jgi:hypothetical protein
MTDTELLDTVSGIVGVSTSTAGFKPKVELLVKNGLRYLYGKTRPYWIKISDTIALVNGDYIVDLADKFDDYMTLNFMYITGYEPLTPKTELMFRVEYPDDTVTGVPHTYTPLGENKFQLYPRVESVCTLNVKYQYRPSFDTITIIPEEWRHVILHYVLMMYSAEMAKTYGSIFFDSLKDIITMAKQSVEDDYDIIPDAIQNTIPATVGNLTR